MLFGWEKSLEYDEVSPTGSKKSQSCKANTLRTLAEKLKVKGGWTTIFDVVDGTWSKKNKSSRNRNIIVKGNTQVDTSSPWLQHTCRQRCSDVNTNSGRIRKMWVKEFVKPLSFHTSTRAESRCDRHLTHICPPCLNTWDKLHKEHYCLKSSSDRDSNPKYTKLIEREVPKVYEYSECFIMNKQINFPLKEGNKNVCVCCRLWLWEREKTGIIRSGFKKIWN